GLCLSAGVVAVLSFFMSEQEFADRGWRLAFLFSAVLVAIGIYIRMRLFETPAFLRVKETRSEAPVPFLELWRTHPKNVLLGMGARYIEGVCFNTYGVYAISYLAGALHRPRSPVLWAVTFAAFVMIFVLPMFGAISDRIGRRRLYGVGAVLTGIAVFPAFGIMAASPSMPWIWVAILVPLGLIYPAVYGPQAALFSELFDTRVRYSGISFVYHFSGILSSGLTPVILAYLLDLGSGGPWFICAYVAIVSAISTLCVWAMPENRHRDITLAAPVASPAAAR
ncbi:MAG: MFS transporter, partial [Alphaproteobacteria bacterium]|nr:MFS transporter [Alphaproteobacteria bacterium]